MKLYNNKESEKKLFIANELDERTNDMVERIDELVARISDETDMFRDMDTTGFVTYQVITTLVKQYTTLSQAVAIMVEEVHELKDELKKINTK